MDMALCFDCRKEVPTGTFRCDKCFKLANNPPEQKIVRDGLTDYEKLKLNWYRSDKAWEDNIRSRKIETARDGSKVVTYQAPNGKREILPQVPYKIANKQDYGIRNK